MTQETRNIINACKGYLEGTSENALERVRDYLSSEYGCDKSCYTDERMNVIMLEVLCDFLDSCNKPSYIIRLLHDVKYKCSHNSEAECIALVLKEVHDCE